MVVGLSSMFSIPPVTLCSPGVIEVLTLRGIRNDELNSAKRVEHSATWDYRSTTILCACDG